MQARAHAPVLASNAVAEEAVGNLYDFLNLIALKKRITR
jgi:hypothetical protein